MIEFQEIVLFFSSRSYEILGEIFDDIEKFAKDKKLSWGYYKDDSFLNSIYVVVPQKNRVVLLLCPQGGRRYHSLHFSTERFDLFLKSLHVVDTTINSGK